MDSPFAGGVLRASCLSEPLFGALGRWLSRIRENVEEDTVTPAGPADWVLRLARGRNVTGLAGAWRVAIGDPRENGGRLRTCSALRPNNGPMRHDPDRACLGL